MEYYGQNGRRYNLKTSPFKKGGEGSVYELVGNDQLVAKIYHAKVVTEELKSKIKYITNNPPDKSILNQIAWPQDYLMDSAGNFVGFVMPKLQINAELGELYVYPPKKIQLTNDQKLVVAINICRVISEIHKAGYVFGDFNPCNIGVNLTTGNVAFLDTDSYHIYDKTTGYTYRCVVCYNGYVAPELIQKCKGRDYKTVSLPTFTQETDRFALAIHIFKLLFNGFTPYNGILETERSSQASPGFGNAAIEQDNYCFKPGNKPLSMAVPPLSSFPQAIQDLFTRAFIDGRNDPTKRPKAEEWDRALCDYRNQLVGCSNNSLHAYYNRLPACPYCEADARYNVMLSIGSVYGGMSSSQISFSQPVAIPSTSQSRTGSGSSGSSTTSNAITKGKRNQARTGFRKKFRIALIIILCVLVAGGAIGGGVYYKVGMDRVNETIELIDYLPNYEVEDYSSFDELILEAYNSYNNLSDWQKKKVGNSDRLLSLMPKYNEYKVTLLRTTADRVTTETVAKTDDLTTCIKLYSELTEEQKAMLQGDEITKFENFITVKKVIDQLNEIDKDVLNRYDQVNEANRLYFSINSEYKDLVYNYYLVDSFADRVALYGHFTFEEVSSGGYSIRLKEGETLKGDVELPSTYNGADVTTIPEGAFYDCRELTSVVVPDTVQTIGKGAFERCNRLQSMTLPFTGKSASASAYEAVFGFIFGYTTQKVDDRQSSSTSFVNSKVGNVDGATWQYSCYNGQWYDYYYGLQSYYYYIPASLTKVTITKQTSIAVAAFNGCNKMIEVQYSSTLRDIGDAAFQGCNLLTSFNSDEENTLDLDGEIETIGSYAFFECEKITDVLFNDENLVVGNHAFDGCSAITELNLPSALRTIGDYAFKNLVLISDLVVHDSTLAIGVGAFNGCKNLVKITLPFTGKSASAEAYEAVFGFIFGYTTQKVDDRQSRSTSFVNSKVGNVDGATWQYSCYDGKWYDSYYGLQSYYYYIPLTIKSVVVTNQRIIPTAAFNNCKNVESIRYEQTIETLSGYALQDCLGLKRFNSETDGTADLSGTYSSVGDNFLRNCTLINKVILPAEIVSIGAYAFENISVSKMEIPDSVESIYIGAFKGCDHLQSITLPFIGKRTTAEAYEAVFGFIFGYTTQKVDDRQSSSTSFVNSKVGNVDGATWQYSCYNGQWYDYYYGLQSYYYYIPASLTKVTITKQTSIAVAAFNGCSNLTDITFQMGLTGQGDCAFQNCTAEIHNGQE